MPKKVQQASFGIHPELTTREKQVHDFFERIESGLRLLVAGILIIFVGFAIVGVFNEIREPLIHFNFTETALRGIDAVFLAIILLELLNTVLARGPISQQLQEFLVIGITATIRHGLELEAGAEGPVRDLVINLAINSLAVLLLVLALWFVRRQLHHEAEPH